MKIVLSGTALFLAGCSTLRFDHDNSGLPLGKSGWELSGGADLEKQVWYVLFVKPWGSKEASAAFSADEIVLPE